jgi:mitochondrial fission protein ELM1
MAETVDDLRAGIDTISLPPVKGWAPSSKPPVRIFIGTEPAQQRAERVLLWSIQRHRDPTRSYGIHLMRELPGFERSSWTTGFTNYRYAIPELAGKRGRAIYNDVDQVYLADPSLLFDADLQPHGFLSVAPGDPSVMLIECERMSDVWSVAAARRESKSTLLARSVEPPGLWGRLAPEWNARDLEFEEERSKLLHFTALHLQPWRPFPERFVYQAHPHAEVWLELEREAERANYQAFDRASPSIRFRRRLAEVIPSGEDDRATGLAELLDLDDSAAKHGALPPALVAHDVALRESLRATAGRSVAIHTCGGGRPWRRYVEAPSGNDPKLEQRWGASRIDVFDIAVSPAADPGRAAAVVCCGMLERMPVEDLPWILQRLFASADSLVHAGIRPDPDLGFGLQRAPALLRRTQDWWLEQFECAARQRPAVHWQLIFQTDGGGFRLREGGRHLGTGPPRVWVLEDDRPGNTSQSRGLAEALGWPYSVKRLEFSQGSRLHNRLLGASLLGIHRARSSPLTPPWPHLVIAAGRRSAPVAQWIQLRNFGRTRLVHLGRKGGDVAARFDLVVAPTYCRLDPHPRRLSLGVPLHNVTQDRLNEAGAHWEEELVDAKRPRIAVLVGGWSGQYRLDAKVARRLGEDVMRVARETGGSILATTSRRTSAAATEAFCSAVKGAVQVHRWSADSAEEENPYLGFLAVADAFIVTGDSESMLAEATSRGVPVHIYSIPERASFRWMRVGRDWVYARAHAWPKGNRGTFRPQRGLEYLCSRLIDLGFVRPARDLTRLYEGLMNSGIAKPMGEPFEFASWVPPTSREEVAERVRDLMGYRDQS